MGEREMEETDGFGRRTSAGGCAQGVDGVCAVLGARVVAREGEADGRGALGAQGGRASWRGRLEVARLGAVVWRGGLSGDAGLSCGFLAARVGEKGGRAEREVAAVASGEGRGHLGGKGRALMGPGGP
jgi:hypothetical protein